MKVGAKRGGKLGRVPFKNKAKVPQRRHSCVFYSFQNLLQRSVEYFLRRKCFVCFLERAEDSEKFFLMFLGKVVRIAHGVYSTMYEERRAMG